MCAPLCSQVFLDSSDLTDLRSLPVSPSVLELARVLTAARHAPARRHPPLLPTVRVCQTHGAQQAAIVQCSTLLVLGTRNVLTRPWCLIEIWVNLLRREPPCVVLSLLPSDLHTTILPLYMPASDCGARRHTKETFRCSSFRSRVAVSTSMMQLRW